jgi:hypothetical protein
MKVEFAKITQPIDLGEYYEPYKGKIVHVWVNPPKSIRKEREELLRLYTKFLRNAVGVETKSTSRRPALSGLLRFFKNPLPTEQEKHLQDALHQVYAWFAQLWSQNIDAESHWTVEEIAEMNERDPALYKWLITRSVLMIDAFQMNKKK